MKRISILVSGVALTATLAAPAAWAEDAAVVAVFDIQDKTGRFSAAQMEQLTTYFSTQLGEGQRFKVVPRAQIKQALTAQKKESYASCFDEQCQIEIGKELAAQKSLQTEIIAVGTQCAIAATLYDLTQAASERSATSKSVCDPDAIVVALEQVARDLRGDRSAAPTVAEPRPPAATAPLTPAVEPINGPAHRVTTAKRSAAYQVVVETQARNFTCPEPVTVARPCQVPSSGATVARLKVTGDADFVEALELGADPARIELNPGLSTGGLISLIGAGVGALGAGIGFLVAVADGKEALCTSGFDASDCGPTAPLVIGGLITTGVGLIGLLVFELASPRVSVEPL